MAIKTPEPTPPPGVHVDPVAPPPTGYWDMIERAKQQQPTPPKPPTPKPEPTPTPPPTPAPPPEIPVGYWEAIQQAEEQQKKPPAPVQKTTPAPVIPTVTEVDDKTPIIPTTPQQQEQAADWLSRNPPPDPGVAPQQYVEWLRSNPNITRAQVAEAAIIERLGTSQGITQEQIEAAFTPDEMRRLGMAGGQFYLPTAGGEKMVSLEEYYAVVDNPDPLTVLISKGYYPQGTEYISDVDAFAKEFDLDKSQVEYLKLYPYATPEMVEYVNITVRQNELRDDGIINKNGELNTDKLIDSNVTEKQLRDAGFDVPDGYIQQLKEYKSFVKDVLPTMPKDMQDAYNKGLKSGDWEPYKALVDKANEEYKQYQEQQRLSGLASEFERYYEKDVAKALSTEPITVKGDDRLRTRGITPDNITAWDVTLAEKELNEFMAEYDKANPNASRDEAAEAIQNSKEYQHYTKVLNIADESPGYDSRVIRDVLTEALSIGNVQTRTFNRKDIERQYEQQKAISVATFKGDDKELTRLYGLGYFGKGDYANEAYVEARRVVNQQKEIENAVKAGDANKLTNLFNEGAFGNDVLGVAQYKNLVNYVNEGGRELAPITPDDIRGVEKSFGTKEEYTKAVLDEQPKLGELAKDFGIALVPVWGTIYHWNNMSGVWKGASIAADALSFVPIIGGISAAAKVASGVGRMARATAALRVVPRLVAAEIIAPATAMLHPVETLKAIGSTAKAGVKYLFDPRFMPASSMGTTYGTTRLEVSVLGDPYASQWVRDQLMLNQKAGKVGAKGSVVFGDKVFTLRSGRIMDGGGVAHASSPSVRFVEEPGGFSVIAKTYPEGHPKAGQRIRESEQGLFVGNTTYERFAEGGSAFGLEKFGKNTPAQRVQLLKDAAETATATGDTAKASKFNKLVSNYNDAIASQSIKKLNKAEAKIISQLNDLSVDEIVTQINTARKKASELYSIGDIEGAQVAMQEALSFERSLQAGRPGYAIFSPEVAVMAVPSDKLFPGAMFKAGLDDIWVISATELKQDKAAKILMEAADAKRLGNDALSGELTKKAHDMMKGGKTGFKKVSTAELELKFPEMTKLPQMKAQYTTQTPSGAKLWIYTNEPYSFKKVLKAKVMAPIDTLVNIFSPAIKVRTIPMTRAQKLRKIEQLYNDATDMEKAGNATVANAAHLQAKYLINTMTPEELTGVVGAGYGNPSKDIHSVKTGDKPIAWVDDINANRVRAKLYGLKTEKAPNGQLYVFKNTTDGQLAVTKLKEVVEKYPDLGNIGKLPINKQIKLHLETGRALGYADIDIAAFLRNNYNAKALAKYAPELRNVPDSYKRLSSASASSVSEIRDAGTSISEALSNMQPPQKGYVRLIRVTKGGADINTPRGVIFNDGIDSTFIALKGNSIAPDELKGLKRYTGSRSDTYSVYDVPKKYYQRWSKYTDMPRNLTPDELVIQNKTQKEIEKLMMDGGFDEYADLFEGTWEEVARERGYNIVYSQAKSPVVQVKTSKGVWRNITKSERSSLSEEVYNRIPKQIKIGEVPSGYMKAVIKGSNGSRYSVKIRNAPDASNATDISNAIKKALIDDASTEHLQAARIAEESGDFTSADRLRREAERIAGRKYVQEIVRRQGTVSGLATYARTGGMQRLLRETTPIHDARIPLRETGDGRATRARTQPREIRDVRTPDTRASRIADTRTTDARTLDERRTDIDRTTRNTADVRDIERDLTERRDVDTRSVDTRELRTPRTTRTPDILRIPRQGDVTREPRTPRIPEPRTPRQPRTPEPRIPDTNIARVIDYGDETAATKTRSVPTGSIAWRQGMFWKYIDPKDFTRGEKPQTLPRGVTPAGAVKTSLRTPNETIQVIGKDNSRVPDTIRIDKGVVDITISNRGKQISFTGKGRRTNVGKRIDSTTTGMSVNGVSGDIISDRELQEADAVISDRVTRTQSTKQKAKRKKKSDNWLDDLTSLKGMRY